MKLATDGEPTTRRATNRVSTWTHQGAAWWSGIRERSSLLDGGGRSHYAFVFQPGKGGGGRARVGRVAPDGVALCFASNPLMTFVPVVHGVCSCITTTARNATILTTTCARRKAQPGGRGRRARCVEETTGARKATVDLKPQLRAMAPRTERRRILRYYPRRLCLSGIA